MAHLRTKHGDDGDEWHLVTIHFDEEDTERCGLEPRLLARTIVHSIERGGIATDGPKTPIGMYGTYALTIGLEGVSVDEAEAVVEHTTERLAEGLL